MCSTTQNEMYSLKFAQEIRTQQTSFFVVFT